MVDPIKEAFSKAKQDIFSLQSQLEILKRNIQEIKRTLDIILENQQSVHLSNKPTNLSNTQNSQYGLILSETATIPTHNLNNISFQHIKSTDNLIPTHKMPQYSLIPSDKEFSTGNEGVPTNQPTNQQTNQHIGNEGVISFPMQKLSPSISQIEKISDIINSLDSIKKELRVRFKKLTSQEMSVFSSIYELEEQGFIVDYSLLSSKLGLTEISIRDYIRKLVNKGIPVDKIKENNKKITLKVSKDFKKIAPLATIIQLREL